MLLAKAVVMTSPLVATLGLSTMIPMSVTVDYLRGLAHLSPQFFLGTIAVFVGFQVRACARARRACAPSLPRVCLAESNLADPPIQQTPTRAAGTAALGVAFWNAVECAHTLSVPPA
eukprot:3757878-Prymnesium_polylepis.1